MINNDDICFGYEVAGFEHMFVYIITFTSSHYYVYRIQIELVIEFRINESHILVFLFNKNYLFLSIFVYINFL